MSTTLLLQGGIGADGQRLDVRTDPATGTVRDIGAQLDWIASDRIVDCRGMVLLEAPVEPHAHLDKALSADAAPNPVGDLAGAVAAWRAYRPTLTHDDIKERARRAVRELVAHGTTAIRSHVDVGDGIELRGLAALIELRDELQGLGLVDLQLVALISPPTTGDGGASMRAMVRDAMALGADVVGGAPHIDPDPAAATRGLVELAAELGAPIDLHVDEQLSPTALWLRDYATAVADAHGAIPCATAGHCVSLGIQSTAVQEEVAGEVHAAGINIVTLPQTNLYLQARGLDEAPPRGLTAVRALRAAGATVAAGADNVRDPFNAVGRSDALETAALLVMAAHLSPAEAWDAVSRQGRKAMGLPPAPIEPGAQAEILAVRGSSLADAIARGSEHRVVVHRGALVATTTVTTTFSAPAPTPIQAAALSEAAPTLVTSR
ncbi:MAG: amidohydrolase family protein [Patulibacter minatonensis]